MSDPVEEPTKKDGSLPILGQPSSRRTALKVAGAALGLAAFGKAVSPLMVIPENVSVDEFLQQHYKELTAEDKAKVFERLESETKENYGADVTLSDPRRQVWLCDQPEQVQRQREMHGSMQQGKQSPSRC